MGNIVEKEVRKLNLWLIKEIEIKILSWVNEEQ